MRRQLHGEYFKLWLSANDTYNWAHKSNAIWPGSFLSDKSLFVEIDRENGDLIDMLINGGRGDQDCPSDELTAIVEDFLTKDLDNE